MLKAPAGWPALAEPDFNDGEGAIYVRSLPPEGWLAMAGPSDGEAALAAKFADRAALSA